MGYGTTATKIVGIDGESYRQDDVGNMNHAQKSNGWVCKCKEHHGVGEWSPSKRAAVYKRQIDLGFMILDHMLEYVKSYKREHGEIIYELRTIEFKDQKSKLMIESTGAFYV